MLVFCRETLGPGVSRCHDYNIWSVETEPLESSGFPQPVPRNRNSLLTKIPKEYDINVSVPDPSGLAHSLELLWQNEGMYTKQERCF